MFCNPLSYAPVYFLGNHGCINSSCTKCKFAQPSVEYQGMFSHHGIAKRSTLPRNTSTLHSFLKLSPCSITGFCPTWLQLLSLPLSTLEQERGYMKQGCRGTSSFPEAKVLPIIIKTSVYFIFLSSSSRCVVSHAPYASMQIPPGKRPTFELS